MTQTTIEELKPYDATDYANEIRNILISKLSAANERIKQLEAREAVLVEALEKLARLGNGDQYGNSNGNVIAQAALNRTPAEAEPTKGDE